LSYGTGLGNSKTGLREAGIRRPDLHSTANMKNPLRRQVRFQICFANRFASRRD